ncbi:MAG: hypothetical protein COU69_04165 [Candidatus Pacebacteria bacterium CG10_big_fil_rev_8_21_14_0_10_56_10]|nr:MAG: hypothetical protein COU69_04165 [Candidatus Pacebacteria bacterium CG10_big_fil_rev_8_21_14_0_10_56_10]
MGSQRNVDKSMPADSIKVVKSPGEAALTKLEQEGAGEGAVGDSDQGADRGANESTAVTSQTGARPAGRPKKRRQRSAKYQLVRSQLDRTKTYDPFAAVELVKRLSYSGFDGSVEAHLVLNDSKLKADVKFPHSTGQQLKVAIASDEVVEQIAAGSTDFDVLLSTPEFMPKLTKHARLLGPKGLMPNPKNGTLTDDPAAAKQALAAGRLTLQTEKKAPLIHVVIGKTSMDTKQLVENLKALLVALKGKVIKLSLSASMSPGVRVATEE